MSRSWTLSPSRQEEYVVSMEDGLRRVQKIVRQLLDFSQQHNPELALADIHQVIHRVLALVEHLFTPHHVRLVTALATDMPEIMIDRHMMEQVLMNLILNAIQAMGAGGVLTIRTWMEGTNCLVQVRDSGCGISPSVLPRIFDPFFTTKKEGEGTGLGLSVSLGIVERHGGKISVESEVGKGTAFTLSIPLAMERFAGGRFS